MGLPEDRVREVLDKVFVEEENEDKYFLIGSSLNQEEMEQVIKFLKDNIDVFAWQSYDMPASIRMSCATSSTMSQPQTQSSKNHAELLPRKQRPWKRKFKNYSRQGPS